MYDFHYNYMKVKYGEKAKLLFTDTDSLCYEIQTDDVYIDMHTDQHLFDTCKYNPDHFLYSLHNKKVIGKMKDECDGKIIEEFVGLRPKMYSMVFDGKEKKTAKGIKRTEAKKLKQDMYRSCLFDENIQMCHMNQIRSFGHQLHSISINKIGLSPYDDKRYVLSDGTNTLAHGHYNAV